MPIIKSAKKAARQATKRKAKNVQIKKDIKNALKAFKANPTAENMRKIQSEYDKAAKKGLIKKNTASRRKSAVAKFAMEAGVKMDKKVATKASTKKKVEAKKRVAEKKATVKKSAEKKAAEHKEAIEKVEAKKAEVKKAVKAKKAEAKKTVAKAKAAQKGE